MTFRIMFNSRDEIFRNPTGAISVGESIHFKITLERDRQAQASKLIITGDNNYFKVLDMFWCGMNGETQEWWECDFSPQETGLYFYHFEIQNWHGTMNMYRGNCGEGIFDSSNNWWQITVYDKNFNTPNWLAGGLIYQIFPDRFFYSGEEKINLPSDRTLRDDWGATPHYQANEKGVITNSDYFRGDLKGIIKKLSYIKSLGVTCIYLNPIFEAHSNHRYDTANYNKIDPLLGDENDLKELCIEAEKLGISVILDGVFNHTGSDSIYFNKEGRYDSLGAYNSQSSEYINWFNFNNWNEDYESWWGFDTLPNVNQNNNEYKEYITGENGIVKKWIRNGTSGWRLDVADELSDETLDNIYKASKEENPNSLVIGEVWEDATTKFAYGKRRRYLLGGQMDSVMNYPFREAILSFLNGETAQKCQDIIESVIENYPPQVLKLLMNSIGTHDTERAITLLAGESLFGRDRKWQSETKLSQEQKDIGIKKMKLASLMQFALPGVPSIYYGDEALVEGYKDPFNRACYPWGKENLELLCWYKKISKIRKENDIFVDGKYKSLLFENDIICFKRYKIENDCETGIIIAINRSSNEQELKLKIPQNSVCVLGDKNSNNRLRPFGYKVFKY